MSESREQLKKEFQDEEYRYSYAEDFLNTWVATQIVTLREQRNLSQIKLGKLIGTKQPGVSRLEDVNHSTWKTETLKKIARALGVRLNITFETFGTLLDQDEHFSREYLMRPEFRDDPAFADDLRPAAQTECQPSNLVNIVEFLNRKFGQESVQATPPAFKPIQPAILTWANRRTRSL